MECPAGPPVAACHRQRHELAQSAKADHRPGWCDMPPGGQPFDSLYWTVRTSRALRRSRQDRLRAYVGPAMPTYSAIPNHPDHPTLMFRDSLWGVRRTLRVRRCVNRCLHCVGRCLALYRYSAEAREDSKIVMSLQLSHADKGLSGLCPLGPTAVPVPRGLVAALGQGLAHHVGRLVVLDAQSEPRDYVYPKLEHVCSRGHHMVPISRRAEQLARVLLMFPAPMVEDGG